MSMKMTKFQLFALLTNQGAANITLPDGKRGIVQSVEREDGSGRSFNVKVSIQEPWFDAHSWSTRYDTVYHTVYVRTID